MAKLVIDPEPARPSDEDANEKTARPEAVTPQPKVAEQAAPARAEITAVEQPRIRSDFNRLAPFLSMDGLVTLEILDAARVANKVTSIYEYAATQFDSHPILAEIGAAHMQYLIQAEATIIPVFRAAEIDVDAILMELASRFLENQLVRAWQAEADRKCCASYCAVMPVARTLAATSDVGNMKRFQIQDGHGRLALINLSSVTTTNTTIAVTFESITGNVGFAYYFVPSWLDDSEYTIRLPVDWSSRHGTSPVRMAAEILSDQWSTSSISFELPDARVHAARAALAHVKRLTYWSPKEAIELLELLRGRLPADPAIRKQYKGLFELAKQRVSGKPRRAQPSQPHGKRR